MINLNTKVEVFIKKMIDLDIEMRMFAIKMIN